MSSQLLGRLFGRRFPRMWIFTSISTLSKISSICGSYARRSFVVRGRRIRPSWRVAGILNLFYLIAANNSFVKTDCRVTTCRRTIFKLCTTIKKRIRNGKLICSSVKPKHSTFIVKQRNTKFINMKRAIFVLLPSSQILGYYVKNTSTPFNFLIVGTLCQIIHNLFVIKTRAPSTKKGRLSQLL